MLVEMILNVNKLRTAGVLKARVMRAKNKDQEQSLKYIKANRITVYMEHR
jgi:hypothetical protein